MTDYNIAAGFVTPYDFGNRQDMPYDANKYLTLRNMRLRIREHLNKLEKEHNGIQKEINKAKGKLEELVEEAETLDDDRDAKRLSSLERSATYYEKKFKEKINEGWICLGKHKAYMEMLSELEYMLDSCFAGQIRPS